MDTQLKNGTSLLCPDGEEAHDWFHSRFLRNDKGATKQFIDLMDGTYHNTVGAVIGVIVNKFGCTIPQATEFLTKAEWTVKHWSSISLYRPGGPTIISSDGKHHINLWTNDGTKACPKTCPSPFLEFMSRALSNEEEVNFVLDVLAHRMQHPMSKAHHILYLYGEAQGQGKSLFADTISKVFGDSAVRVCTNVRELKGQNAYQLWSRTWLIAEETKVNSDSALYDAIKAMSGSTSMIADPKHQSSQRVEIPAQLIMLSNRPPLFLEQEDRRFFVANWDTGLRGSAKTDYFEQYIAWLENGGVAAIAHLLQTRCLENYRVASHAPSTEAKREAITKSVPYAVELLRQHLSTYVGRLFFTPDDLSYILQRHSSDKHRQQHLEQAGLEKRRFPVDGKPTLYYRKDSLWEKITPHQLKFCLDETIDVYDCRNACDDL